MGAGRQPSRHWKAGSNGSRARSCAFSESVLQARRRSLTPELWTEMLAAA